MSVNRAQFHTFIATTNPAGLAKLRLFGKEEQDQPVRQAIADLVAKGNVSQESISDVFDRLVDVNDGKKDGVAQGVTLPGPRQRGPAPSQPTLRQQEQMRSFALEHPFQEIELLTAYGTWTTKDSKGVEKRYGQGTLMRGYLAQERMFYSKATGELFVAKVKPSDADPAELDLPPLPSDKVYVFSGMPLIEGGTLFLLSTGDSPEARERMARERAQQPPAPAPTPAPSPTVIDTTYECRDAYIPYTNERMPYKDQLVRVETLSDGTKREFDRGVYLKDPYNTFGLDGESCQDLVRQFIHSELSPRKKK